MKKVYVIFTKDHDGEVWLESIRTNETQAFQTADVLKNSGHAVAVSAVRLNEIAYLRINSANDLSFVRHTDTPTEFL